MPAPFMLTVVPIGIENEEIFGEMPSLLVQKFIVNGIVTALLLVAKGIDISVGIFFRNGNGEIFPTSRINNM